MKNIQRQYQDLLEGKMSKANFMVNARRDFPQWIAPTNSFNDAVKILKSKRILSESHEGNTQWMQAFADALKSKGGILGDEDYFETYEGHTPEEAAEIEARLQKSEREEQGEMDVMSQWDMFEELGENDLPKHDDTPKHKIIAQLMGPDYFLSKKNEREWDDKDYDAFYRILKMAQETGKVPKLNEAAQKPEGKYKEVTGKAEYNFFPGADHVNYNQLMKGLQYELSKMGEITDEALVKAKQKAVKNLVKDPNAYRDLVIANVKSIEKEDKTLKMQPVKKDNMVDKANGMKVVEKDAKGNVQDNLGKKERAKSKNGEGLKHMTQTPKKSKGIAQVMDVPGKEKVLALKEHILEDLTVQNPNKKEFQVNQRVETNDGRFAGVITGFDGHTVTVTLDTTGQPRHFQPNFLKHSDAPPRPKLPNYQSDFIKNAPPLAQKEGMSKEDKLKAIKEKLMKFVKKEVEEGAVATVGGSTVASGRNPNDVIKAAKELEKQIGDQVTVTDTKSGKKTQV